MSSFSEIATAVISCSQIISTLKDQLGPDHSIEVQASLVVLARGISEIGLLLSQLTVVTSVANLTAATSVGTGAFAYVTDANATTFASVVAGGGASTVPVYSDGTNWRIG